jgi:hypothetical protein
LTYTHIYKYQNNTVVKAEPLVKLYNGAITGQKRTITIPLGDGVNFNFDNAVILYEDVGNARVWPMMDYTKYYMVSTDGGKSYYYASPIFNDAPPALDMCVWVYDTCSLSTVYYPDGTGMTIFTTSQDVNTLLIECLGYAREFE